MSVWCDARLQTKTRFTRLSYTDLVTLNTHNPVFFIFFLIFFFLSGVFYERTDFFKNQFYTVSYYICTNLTTLH
jgi:hypothetical protein